METTNIGELIRTRREALGLSQDELAIASGYTNRSSIAKIENGSVEVPISKLEKIAKTLNMRLIDFFPHNNYKITHEKLWLGEIVRKRREEMGLTRDDLAALSGYDIGYINELESGSFTYPIEVLENISDKLGLRVLDMLASCHAYYHIYQDKKGVSHIDSCGLDEENVFCAMSFDESLLVDVLYDLQNDNKKMHELLNFAKLLKSNEFSKLSSIFSSFKILNETGIQKAAERIHELTEIERYRKDGKSPTN